VPEDKDFQARLQTLGSLLHDLETITDPASRSAAKELVQLLMDLHGSGLERILEIVFQSGEVGGEIIDKLGRDSLVSSLLVLYGLHPEELQTRVERKLEQIRSKLHKMGAQAKCECTWQSTAIRVARPPAALAPLLKKRCTKLLPISHL
jgi:hypothetical protein